MGVIDTVKWYFGVMTSKRFGNTDVDGKGHLPLTNKVDSWEEKDKSSLI